MIISAVQSINAVYNSLLLLLFLVIRNDTPCMLIMNIDRPIIIAMCVLKYARSFYSQTSESLSIYFLHDSKAL